MKLLSKPISAILLLLALIGSFFVSAVKCGDGERENFSHLQAALHALSVEGIKEVKLEDQGNDRSLVAVPRYTSESAGARSLLDADSESGTLLVVHEDGKFELKDTLTKETLWEISTDQPLTSQSQVYIPDSDYFLFPGQGGELYIYTRSAGIQRIPLSIEEYVARTPEIRDSTVTFGSKSSTMYTVDADTGVIIYQSCLPANLSHFGVSMTEDSSLPSQLPSGAANEEQPSKYNYITIIRTDYTLSCSDTSRTLWNWTSSFFAAYYPNGNRYMLKPPSHTGSTIPIHFEGKELLLAWAHSTKKFEPLQLDSITDSNKPLKDTLNGVVSGVVVDPVHPVNENRNGLAILERPFKITGRETEVANFKLLGYHPVVIIALILITGFCLVLLYWKPRKEAWKTNEEKSESNARQNGVSRKKRSRKSGNVNRDGSGGTSGTSHDKNSNNGENKEKRIGKLNVSNEEIGRGSIGTVVLEGVYELEGVKERRPVAVKRLLHAYHDVAIKEIENLIASDHHPNIVRLYGVERDDDFVYISLERCSCSLDDLIKSYSGQESTDFRVKFGKGIDNDMVVLWRENGLPSSQLLKLMRDVVSGLVHLHDLGFIHRDLKPHNVLISTEGAMKAKLCDMGISKRLSKDVSSLSRHATGFGSSGWQAPEQLKQEPQTRAIDVFTFGCLLFFCITKGKHPFGEHYERDLNIYNDKYDLFLVDFIPEAVHLLTLLLKHNAAERPKAIQVLNHPFFWNAEMRVSFLRDTSDRIDKANELDLINAMDNVAPVVLGGKWNEKLDPALIADLGRFRKYNFESVRDLLRVIRNKVGHYRELPSELQESLGSLPEGFDRYFSTRFPKLLIEVYKVVCTHCREEDSFRKYFNSNMALL